jgi:hypothetical protein
VTRHPADDFNMALFNINPAAAAEAWSKQRAAYEREQAAASGNPDPHTPGGAMAVTDAVARERWYSPGATLGGCLVLMTIFVLGFLCGMGVTIVGLAA